MDNPTQVKLTPKRQAGRLSERITVCVDEDMKREYELLSDRFDDVPEKVRAFVHSLIEANRG